MYPEQVPSQFRSYVSDDGTRVSLANRGLASLPEWLGSLTALTELDLGGNQLTALPETLGNLTALTTLRLGGNQLTALPETLGSLTALTELRLGGNQLTSLPETLGNLTALTELRLDGNQLMALPETLGNLTALTALGLGGNRLTGLPETLGNLTALTTLGLGRNRLTSLPEALGNLTALTALRLDGNQLIALPETLGNLTALTTLRLDGNQLMALPETLGNLTALTALGLGRNRLTSLPEWLGNLTALTALRLGGNQLMALPETLGNLTALTALRLGGNRLTSLPETLGSLTALTELDLGGNRLTSLPETLGNLTALTALRLDGNRLTALPEWLGNLTALTTLRLDGNQLTALPETLGNLTALTALDLGPNQLTALPEWLGSLTALTALDLGGNQLTALPGLGSLTALTALDLGRNQLAALPGLGSLTALTALGLDGNRLMDLPEWLGSLTALTELGLGGNRLTDLPEWLGNLTALTELHLWGNQLTALPETLGNLTALTLLDLGGNQLTGLPERLGSLTALTELRLDGNQLTSLPETLVNLTALTTLDLDDNQLTMLPETLGNLTALATLDLDDNQLTMLPETLGNLTALARLDLDGNQLTALPETLGNLTALTRLDLDGNQLTALPETLGNLTALTRLDLDGNQLTALPETLGNLTALTTLRLDGNQLTSLPEWLGNVTALTTLGVGDNQLTALPETLGSLTVLATLDLGGNQLTALPETLGSLTALTALGLGGNQLTSLPEWLGNVTALTELHLWGNQLTALPETLGNLTSLTLLDLEDNPLQSPLLEISKDGVAAVKAYLTLTMDRAAELWQSKLLVVGQGAVGKTSLVKALVGQEHDPHEPTTHGIRIVEIKLSHPDRPNVVMHLSSWDFGGQDIYHATHQFFLSDRSLFVLLWNAREGWEQAKLPYWLHIIKARAPHARVILVATHSEGRPIDLPLIDQEAFAGQIVACVGVDCSTGEGIDQLRQTMAGQAAKLPLMGSRWPATWVTGVEAINKSGLQHATPADLYHRLSAAGVTDRSHQAYLLRALHLLGDILYFDEDEELRDTIILRPQWVNDYIAKVLDSPEVAAKHGLLTRFHERQLWSELDPGLRDRFLLMMEKVDLSYRIPDDPEATSLVVERLPWESPPYQKRWEAASEEPGAREIRLRYQLNTLPPGIPTWFIAREHRFSTHTAWRSGALLRHTRDPRVLGLIRAERQDNTVDLAVRGPVPQLFFGVLQDGFESTLSRYQGLEITRLVPCTCAQGAGTQPGQPCMHLYKYDPLLRRMEQGVPEVECELSFLKVSVADLLFGISPTTMDQLVRGLADVKRTIRDFRTEVEWNNREFLKALRRVQARAEAICPSIFTLTPATGGIPRPGFHRLELRLYCEQPGAFHALPESPYIINQPTRWLVSISPYLTTLVTILKHTAPLVGPVLGLTSDYLAKQLASETQLMAELVRQLPESSGGERLQADMPPGRAELDVDYRALCGLLHRVDPNDHWAGLSRLHTPEGDVLWLCRDHAEQYSS